MVSRRSVLALPLLAASAPAFAQSAPVSTLLNVSYDVAREIYKDINPAFIAYWKDKTGQNVTVNQSHGGSSKQVLAVAGGLEADVVTMNQSPDIEFLAQKAGLVDKDWAKKLPFGAAPYWTTTIFIVRKGNPKGIKDWADLAREGVSVIVPNPKVTGNGRYTYLAAYGYALTANNGDAQKARDFVAKLFANVPVLDGGGRSATTTFAQRELGDVLVTFENETNAITKEFGEGKFEAVYPSISIYGPAPVAVVDKVVDKRGSRALAEAYLKFLYEPQAQEIFAQHFLRVRDETIKAKNASRFPEIKTFTVEDLLGGWDKAQTEHFADGGVYDQIMAKRK